MNIVLTTSQKNSLPNPDHPVGIRSRLSNTARKWKKICPRYPFDDVGFERLEDTHTLARAQMKRESDYFGLFAPCLLTSSQEKVLLCWNYSSASSTTMSYTISIKRYVIPPAWKTTILLNSIFLNYGVSCEFRADVLVI